MTNDQLIELLREARDSCKAAAEEEGISPMRREYREELSARLDRAANLIESMAQREPVATVHYPRTGGNAGLSWCAIPESGVMPKDGEKLYLAPVAQRVPLTEQEIWDAVEHGVIGGIGLVSKAVKVARAIEQAHGIRSDK